MVYIYFDKLKSIKSLHKINIYICKLKPLLGFNSENGNPLQVSHSWPRSVLQENHLSRRDGH